MLLRAVAIDDERLELAATVWRDVDFEARGVTTVIALDHLPYFMQSRNYLRPVMGDTQFDQLTHRAQEHSQLAQQLGDALAVTRRNTDRVGKPVKVAVQQFACFKAINLIEYHQR